MQLLRLRPPHGPLLLLLLLLWGQVGVLLELAGGFASALDDKKCIVKIVNTDISNIFDIRTSCWRQPPIFEGYPPLLRILFTGPSSYRPGPCRRRCCVREVKK